MAEFAFLTNHAQALICVSRQPDLRLRDIASELDITERATHRIISDLVDAGYLARHREGRRNSYEVQVDRIVPAPVLRDLQVGQLLGALAADPPARA
jgi:predicted HTH transcriptional regulator